MWIFSPDGVRCSRSGSGVRLLQFEALNIPKHIRRDARQALFNRGYSVALTSPFQARIMEQLAPEPQYVWICPAVVTADPADATHHQCFTTEVLVYETSVLTLNIPCCICQ